MQARTEPSPTLIDRLIAGSRRNCPLVLLLTLLGVAGGIYALYRIPLDAVPDVSDVQVIVYTNWEGRSPDLVEDQITYPITARFIGAPKVKSARGESMFGKSFVYIIFEDGTDLYWARSRVVEYLNGLRGSLPEGVNPAIGPDATGAGWVFELALVDESGRHNLAELRTFQDWHLRYALESIQGVAEIATVVDPALEGDGPSDVREGQLAASGGLCHGALHLHRYRPREVGSYDRETSCAGRSNHPSHAFTSSNSFASSGLVHPDPSLPLNTRRCTGYYKVP